jgi:hypothetical protein
MPIDRRQPPDRRTPQLPKEGHAERVARFDTLELEERLRREKAQQRRTRAEIEAELRREHFGRLPEHWNDRPRRAA